MTIFKMTTRQGEKIEFLYSGCMKYKPNKSSTCGYGSDDWYYLCYNQGGEYMLNFSDDAGYGTIWVCVKLWDGGSEKLKKAETDLWIDTYFKRQKQFDVTVLHLDNIDEVMDILPKASRCNVFTEHHFRGMY